MRGAADFDAVQALIMDTEKSAKQKAVEAAEAEVAAAQERLKKAKGE